ncbi:helix-turn-helix domain-containing protein [Nonomuraea bangladeshensis]|uniref:helix-turn-helix domain-containing protein n=1 Tax=Nonomuraea bangladeshensis TaxID=404385 RepID=UPI003C2EE0B5
MGDEQTPLTPLTLEDVCRMLQVSRSTAKRMLVGGHLTGVKRHDCGTVCGNPLACKQGAWQFTRADVDAAKAALALSETGR